MKQFVYGKQPNSKMAMHHLAEVPGMYGLGNCERMNYIVYTENKPAAQAAGADPSRFNSTNRQNNNDF